MNPGLIFDLSAIAFKVLWIDFNYLGKIFQINTSDKLLAEPESFPSEIK